VLIEVADGSEKGGGSWWGIKWSWLVPVGALVVFFVVAIGIALIKRRRRVPS